MESLTRDISELELETNGYECPAIDQLIASSKTLDSGEEAPEHQRLTWILFEKLTEVESITQPDQVIYYARYKYTLYESTWDETMVLLPLGTREKCTQAFINELAKTHSLPIYRYINSPNGNTIKFKRYSKWLESRNNMIRGFTKHEDIYYMVAGRPFYHCYSLYGFCPACGTLRCSPVWCICGHKELFGGWTSNNNCLDGFIKKSQQQTNSPNEAYLEWIPFDRLDFSDNNINHDGESTATNGCASTRDSSDIYIDGSLPIVQSVKLTPLDISDTTDDQYFDQLCVDKPNMLNPNVWSPIGFTYDPQLKKYALVSQTEENTFKLCLACKGQYPLGISAFCYFCKASNPPDWTCGNKSVDSFIAKSWNNVHYMRDNYLQWIEPSHVQDLREASSLDYGCTHLAEWSRPSSSNSITVMLKKIVNEQNAQSFDFNKLIEEHPTILTPENDWIIGITRTQSPADYYLVFYSEINQILDRFMRILRILNHTRDLKFIDYNDFDEVEEIGSGGYGTVYRAKSRLFNEQVALKKFNQSQKLFIREFKNYIKSSYYEFLPFHGVTQHPETKEYLIVMQYANNGDVMSYLNKNINKLTWKMKLDGLLDIVNHLEAIHKGGLIHGNLHGGNIVFNEDDASSSSMPNICDIGLGQSVDSSKSNSPSTVRGVLPYIAPEIFHTHEFTQKSDIYAFGILMYLMASGEPPFSDRQFDDGLVRDILDGLRPSMPDSAPEPYVNIAEKCCDADPDKRPDAEQLRECIGNLIDDADEIVANDDIWNIIYQNENLVPLTRAEKESKYTSKPLPTGNWSNSH